MRPKMTFIPLLMLVWATMLSAFPHEGAIVGTVRSTGGIPQMRWARPLKCWPAPSPP